MADREELAEYLHVKVDTIPGNPEAIEKPKAQMLQIARRSRSRVVREDMLPRPSGGAKVGPLYSARMIEFATKRWRPQVAAMASDSLRRSLQRISELIEAYRAHLSL